MKHCIHCGEKLEKDATFCTNCGNPIEKASSPEQNNKPSAKETAPVSSTGTTEERSRSDNQNKSPKSKRNKTITTIIAIIAVIFFGSYFMINKFILSPEAIANQFMDGVEENNVSKVQDLINDARPSLKASQEEVEGFLDYLNDNPKVLSEVSSELQNAVEDPSSYTEASGELNDEELVTMQENGKKWLLFNHHAIAVAPMYLEIELPEDTDEEVKLFINDEKEDTKSKDTVNVGPLLPGTHKVTAEIDGEYGKVENEKAVDFSETGTEAFIEFDFQEENYVSIYSDNDDATIYVNDEDSKQTVDDVFDKGLGPIPKDGSIELHAEKKFSKGTKKSDSVTIDQDTQEADLTLGYDDYDEEYGDDSDVTFDDEDDDKDSEEEEKDIEDIITNHYDSISDGEYETAYDYFSDSKMDEYSLDTWSDDLKDTIEDEVVSVEVEDVGDDKAETTVEMTSREKDGDDIQVREWEGTWELITEDGDWKLDKADLEEKDTYTE